MTRGGRAPDAAVRDLLEAVFAVDLGEVRFHAGRVARGVAARFGASAVTFGRRVLFAAHGWRECDRRGVAGVALAAHEVAHVLQYRRDGLAGMLTRYVAEYLRGRWRGLGHAAAYRAIGYEREAVAWAAAVAELLEGDPELAAEVAAGRRLPAPLWERAAAAGRRVRP